MGNTPFSFTARCFCCFAIAACYGFLLQGADPKYVKIHPPKKKLVGGLEHECSFSILIGNFIIPTDVHSMIFQRGRSTTNQISVDHTGIPFPRKRPAPRVALRQGPPSVGAPLLGPDGRALRALPLRLQMSEDRLKESLGHRAAFLEGPLCWINRMI